MVRYNDDEEILANADEIGAPRPYPGGKTNLRVINKQKKAPLEETKYKVLLELAAAGPLADKSPGVDIVAILDVSGSMQDDNKLETMKTAMQFVIKKLNPAHRLSIVKFSSKATRLCPLRQMNEKAQTDIGAQVDELHYGGGTNIADALRLALQVLDERQYSAGRVAAIMLMSDGDQGDRYDDARTVEVNQVPVHTFGFGRGSEYNPEVLNAIAANSKGGTFSIADIENTESDLLSIAFSQCLGGLLTVAVRELNLTITPIKVEISDEDSGTRTVIKPIIEKVEAGSYQQSTPDANNESVTVTFGDLYKMETRKTMVDLLLPAVNFSEERGIKVLKISYQYLFGDQLFESAPVTVSVIRTGDGVDEPDEEVVGEEKRVETVEKVEKATKLADRDNLPEARNELKQAQNSLDEVITPSDLINALKYEVEQLLKFMQSSDIYKSKGKHYALSLLTSHARQRFAAKGDDPAKTRLFATPAMDLLLDQVIKFISDPTVTPDIEVEPVVIPEPTPTVNPPAVISNPIMVQQLNRLIGSVVGCLQGIEGALQDIQLRINARK